MSPPGNPTKPSRVLQRLLSLWPRTTKCALRRWPDLLLGAYCAGSVAVGVAGFGWSPSPALEADLGVWWLRALSSLIIISSLTALVGILMRVRRALLYGIVALAFSTLIHGISIIATGQWQTGLRLTIAPLMMVPAIIGYNFWMMWRDLQVGDDEK